MNSSTFVTPAGVLNLNTPYQSSPVLVAVLGTWCANPNHISFTFPYNLSNLNSIIILCLDPVPHPSTHLYEVFMLSIVLRVFQQRCFFLALQLQIPTACHCHYQHLDGSMSLPRTQIFSLVFHRLLKPSSNPFVGVIKLFDVTRLWLFQSSWINGFDGPLFLRGV